MRVQSHIARILGPMRRPREFSRPLQPLAVPRQRHLIPAKLHQQCFRLLPPSPMRQPASLPARLGRCLHLRRGPDARGLQIP